MSTVIAETSRGPVEMSIVDMPDRALHVLAAAGHPEAIAEFWRRKLGTPRWAHRLNGRMEDRR